MASNSEADGTQTATIGTEHTLFTGSDATHYMVYVDKTNMESGDRLEVRIKVKIKAGGSAIVVAFAE